MIKLEKVKVTFKDKKALDMDNDIYIESGDRVGVIGSNGAGKTTLIRSILGLVDYKGIIKADIEPEEMAVHMQSNEYAETMAVRFIMEAILGYKLESNPQVMEMIEFFDFTDCLKKRYKHLSGGQKQRLTLILVMCQDSSITMFDEVTSGLDFETRQRLMDKLIDWYKDKDTTLLITSHYYTELENIVNKILFLDKGKVIDYGNKQDLFKKYCGNAIIIFPDSKDAKEIVVGHKQLIAPKEMIAISCLDSEEESLIAKKLSDKNINYRRSNDDIELMTINAKAKFYGGNANE